MARVVGSARRPRWSNVSRDLLAGIVASLLPISSCFTFAALIFSGAWQPFLAQGVAALLISGAVIAMIGALTSNFRAAIAGPSSSTSALLAVMLAALAPVLADQPPAVALATAYAALGAATLVTGGTLLALGALQLGKIVRFVPYPVIAGFMAATGWLMITGAIRLATDQTLSLQTLPFLFDPQTGARLAALIAFGAILLALARRSRHPLTIPLALAAATLATDATCYLAHVPFATARAAGWLFELNARTSPTIPLLSGAIVQANWPALLQVAAAIAPVVVVGVMQSLVTATGLELALDTEADLDHELRCQGAANIASALLGGVAGFISTSYTQVNVASGGRGRASGVVVSLVALAALAGGSDVMAFIPRFVLAALLFMLGAKMLWQWLIASRASMTRREWLLAGLVVVTAALFSLLLAVLAGMIGGCVLLALSLSKLGIVRRRFGVDEQTSSLQRSEADMLVLAAHGAEGQVLELGGFIFFGSAYQLYREVKTLVALGAVRILAIDFSAVAGIDSMALAILDRTRSLARKAGLHLIIAGLEPARLRMQGPSDAALERFATLDEAVEATENAVLANHTATNMTALPRQAAHPGEDWLASAFGDAALAAELTTHLTHRHHAPGEVLCRQGDATDTLLFINTGRISVSVDTPGQPATRLRVLAQHTVAGELAFLLGTPRTATLRVERDASVGWLDRAAFDRLSRDQPHLALALLNYLVRVQAERLTFITRQIAVARR